VFKHSKKIRATDAKEVGMGNPAEETTVTRINSTITNFGSDIEPDSIKSQCSLLVPIDIAGVLIVNFSDGSNLGHGISTQLADFAGKVRLNIARSGPAN
jgi:hypothetical protein